MFGDETNSDLTYGESNLVVSENSENETNYLFGRVMQKFDELSSADVYDVKFPFNLHSVKCVPYQNLIHRGTA